MALIDKDQLYKEIKELKKELGELRKRVEQCEQKKSCSSWDNLEEKDYKTWL